MHYIIESDDPWIPCTCKADTPNANSHSNIQCTQCQMESYLAAAPATVLENPNSAVAALNIIPFAVSWATAATNNHQNSGASSRGTQSNEYGRQHHQSSDHNGGIESSENHQLGGCSDDADEPQSPSRRTCIEYSCRYSSSVNDQGGVLTHPVRHLCLTDNI